MRDVSHKVDSLRTATAESALRVSPETVELIQTGQAPKGDPFAVARVAAIQAAKMTPTIIPYCHTVPLDYVGVDFEIEGNNLIATASVKAVYKTGVEMEAMTAAAAATLNLFDLLKPVDDDMEILYVRLLSKTGGKTDAPPVQAVFSAHVIVVSDRVSQGEADDESGAILEEGVDANGGIVDGFKVVPDESPEIARSVTDAVHDGADLVLLTGGTGLGPRDVTPDAILPLLESRLPGIEDHLSQYFRSRLPAAMLGRVFAGRIGKAIVVGLPGSPGAARDAVAALFPTVKHAFHIIKGGGHGG